jgi:hypothetical protein
LCNNSIACRFRAQGLELSAVGIEIIALIPDSVEFPMNLDQWTGSITG